MYRIEHEGKIYYVKKFHQQSGLRSWLGRSRSEAEVKNMLFFSKLGLPTVPLIAWGLEKHWGKANRAFVLTGHVENTLDMRSTVEQNPEFLHNSVWRARLFQLCADQLRTLHEQRFCHGDIHWRNILVGQDPNKPELYLIDCPLGKTFSLPELPYRRIKDLGCLDEYARMYLRKTERLRFYLRYRNIDRLDKRGKRDIRTMLARYS